MRTDARMRQPSAALYCAATFEEAARLTLRALLDLATTRLAGASSRCRRRTSSARSRSKAARTGRR